MSSTRDPERVSGWQLMLALGVVMVLGGLLALANPVGASLTALVIVAAVLIVAGVIQLLIALWSLRSGRGERAMNALLGAALLALGLVLVFRPFAGLVTLTVVVAIVLFAFGLIRVALALRFHPRIGRGLAIASGVLSAALGLVIVVALPEAAGGVLGVVLAIDLLASGLVSILAALRLRDGR